eukprot:TRINITY_DN3070_c0_g1_i6.p1 TRINITY_DN3070_c0_g1~~TRINITY_DN3070_c0_g1_i6.p1  ORF type:complete len:481 (+),score=68.32 TRINITY_DN3070_c0_g1_i6:161-1603(+)
MGFEDELWDGFEIVATKVTDGKLFCKDAQAFIRKRADIERDYARALLSLSQTKTKISENGSLGHTWTTLKSETENVSKAHQAFSEALIANVETGIKNWITGSQAKRKQLKQNGSRLITNYQRAQQNVQKAKSKYEGTRKKQDQLESEVATKPQSAKKLQAEKKNAEKADEEYKEKIKALQELEVKFYETEMPQILSDLEALEHDRIEKMTASLISATNAQATIHPIEKSSLETCEQAVRATDASEDIKKFIASSKTGASQPPRVEYEPYDPAVGACVKPTSSAPAVAPRQSAPISPVSATDGNRSVGARPGLTSSGGRQPPPTVAARPPGLGLSAGPGGRGGPVPFRREMSAGNVGNVGHTAQSGGAAGNIPPHRQPPQPKVTIATPPPQQVKPPPPNPVQQQPGTFKVRALFDYTVTDEARYPLKRATSSSSLLKTPLAGGRVSSTAKLAYSPAIMSRRLTMLLCLLLRLELLLNSLLL